LISEAELQAAHDRLKPCGYPLIPASTIGKGTLYYGTSALLIVAGRTAGDRRLPITRWRIARHCALVAADVVGFTAIVDASNQSRRKAAMLKVDRGLVAARPPEPPATFSPRTQPLLPLVRTAKRPSATRARRCPTIVALGKNMPDALR
jgi:hypothetical protein